MSLLVAVLAASFGLPCCNRRCSAERSGRRLASSTRSPFALAAALWVDRAGTLAGALVMSASQGLACLSDDIESLRSAHQNGRSCLQSCMCTVRKHRRRPVILKLARKLLDLTPPIGPDVARKHVVLFLVLAVVVLVGLLVFGDDLVDRAILRPPVA